MSSLKARLIAIASIWVVVGVALAGAALSSMLSNYLTEQFYGDLANDLKELDSAITLGPDGLPRLEHPLSDPRYGEARSGYYWEIQREGAVVARSASLHGPKFNVPQTVQPQGEIHNHLVEGPTGDVLAAELIHDLDKGAPPLRVIVGSDRRHLDEMILGRFNTTLIWSLGALGLCIILAAAGLIFYALKSLGHLRRALSEVRSGRETRVQGRFPSEVQPLVDDLNSMLESTGQLLQRARAQAGNLAHGLKTPLAILADEAHRIDDSGAHEPASIILEQCRRMQCQIDYQLARARAAAHMARPGTVSSPADVSKSVMSALGRLHRSRPITMRSMIADDVAVACDCEDLNEMLANLIDNACKHAANTVIVRSETDTAAKRVRLLVEDDGPGIPPGARKGVLTFGERLGSQVGGYGLGLAIVRDLVGSYGGTLALGQSDLGGLKVMLDLPAVARSGEEKATRAPRSASRTPADC